MSLTRRTLLQTASATAAAAWPIRGAHADVAGVTLAGKETTITTADISTLDKRFTGDILKPGDAPYDSVRKIWNGSFDHVRPALIARCTSADDVAAAITFAREHDILTAVRAGGHSYSGQSTAEHGLMIDLQPMKDIEVDPVKKIVRCGAGVFLGEFDAAAQKYGLATTAGVIPHTGIAGLTLGGGVGRLMRLHGMTIDNLSAVEIVTAEGHKLRASDTENPDLFWAVRGGAGNFGVVTAFEYRLHQVGPMVQTFAYRYPVEQIRQVMKFHFEFTAAAPDNIHTSGSISSGADGTITASINGTHFGPADEAERLLAPIAKFGKPLSSRVQTVSYLDVQSAGPNPAPHGMGQYSTGGYTGIARAMVDPAADRFMDSPPSGVGVGFFALGGAAGRVANDATAFAHRDALFSVSSSTNWTDPQGAGKEIGEKKMAWCRATWASLRKFGDGGFYANLTSDSGERGVRENYRGNYERLVALKTKYDPTNFFRLNANIQPKA